MNPFGLTATGLVVWGVVAHLIADWLLQSEWMALNKMKRLSWPQERRGVVREVERWWLRHPAAYVHAGIHGALLVPVFGWPAAIIALAHLLIDTRVPVAWWSRLMRQTQPMGGMAQRVPVPVRRHPERAGLPPTTGQKLGDLVDGLVEAGGVPVYDMGAEVRVWNDQVWHVACLAVAALAVGA